MICSVKIYKKIHIAVLVKPIRKYRSEDSKRLDPVFFTEIKYSL